VLLANMAAVDFMGEDGKTALMQASKKGYTGAAKILLENGAIVNLTDKDGWTALMYASSNGYSKIAEMLLERGATIDFIDKNGWTPLMLAAVNGHGEVVEVLLKKGAKTDLANKDGLTAYMLGSNRGKVEVVRILLGKEADPPQTVDNKADFTNPVKSKNKRDSELYVISYVSGSEFWSYWTEHYRLALQYEQISDILKNKLVCFFAVVFSDGKKEHGCMAPPA
jgi:ankyrin repeat protein